MIFNNCTIRRIIFIKKDGQIFLATLFNLKRNLNNQDFGLLVFDQALMLFHCSE